MDLPNRRTACKCSSRRGAAATELALMLPLLMTLALGASDFARVVHDYIVVSNASRIGAEYGATHRFTAYSRSSWESQVRAAITTEASAAAGFDPDKLQIAIKTDPEAYNLVRVTVDVEYPFRPAVRWPAMPQSIQLWRRTSMREFQ